MTIESDDRAVTRRSAGLGLADQRAPHYGFPVMRARSAKHFATALLLPVALLAGVASSADLLVCRMDGVVRSCCCRHEAANANAPVLERAGCCEALHIEQPAPSVEQRSIHSAPLAAPAIALLAPPLPLTSATPAAPLLQRQSRGTTGPPLFLLHRALLI